MTSQAEVEDDVVIEKIEYQMRKAMEEDNALGADGEWVGLLGFSQGAKVAASVLYESQLRAEEAREGIYGGSEDEHLIGIAGGRWRFAVMHAGSAPIVSMRNKERASPTMARPGALIKFSPEDMLESPDKLRLPTVHVLGLQDGGLPLHRKLFDVYCEKGTATMIEWDGDHRIPIKASDVNPVVDAIFKVAKVR